MNRLLEIINEMYEESDKEQIGELKGEMTLRNDLGMDSLMLAEFTVRIENELGVDIFEDGLISTIQEVIDKIERDKQ